MPPKKDIELPEPHSERSNTDAFWVELATKYESETPTRGQALEQELRVVREALSHIVSSSSRYEITAPLGVGGAGVVFKVWDKSLLTFRALKLSRPIEGKEELIAGLLSEEISRLQEVSHPNIISIFDAGTLVTSAGDLPFYAMTYLRGALPAHKYFAESRTSRELLEFFRGMLAGVAHLHEKSLLHLDLKPSNVFVGQDGYAVVADLGGARQVGGDQNEDLLITCTSSYAHPELYGLTQLTSGGDDNRRRGHVKRKQLRFAFDLYAVGKTIEHVMEAFEASSASQLKAYSRKYLTLQAARLLDGHTGANRPLGLSMASLKALRYENASAALHDVDKLMGRVNLLTEIPELSPTNNRVIQVTRGEKTSLTPRLANLLREPLLRRLGKVSQLGLVRLIYPGATHTRLEHSIGTFSNAAQIITALYNDPINPLFRQIVTEEDLVATLLAALFHDLGQYQHAHDLEDVEPKIFKHESLTTVLLKGEIVDFKDLTVTLDGLVTSQWGTSLKRVRAILDANPTKISTEIKDRLLHTLISGPIDSDKLDYLIRDGVQCQTVFARGIDRQRLLGTLTVVYETQGKSTDYQYFALGIHEKGRAAAESVAFTRFQMFRAVYWHHAVRSAKAMLQRAAHEWIAPGGKYDPSQNDRLKRELYDFILQVPTSRKAGEGQSDLFASKLESLSGNVGDSVRPQWSTLNHTDHIALEWLHGRTTDTGKNLLEMIAVRRLFKRVLVVSASQDRALWDAMQDDMVSHHRVREQSEELRKVLKKKIDAVIKAAEGSSEKFLTTGLGADDNRVRSAAAILGLEGSILIDVPRRAGGEVLRFYPEELHRSQREEFGEFPSLAISELWKLLTEKLHETAGNIRVFIHPDLDVLRRAKLGGKGEPVLPGSVIGDELRSLFGLS